jgi:hypothetical protein
LLALKFACDAGTWLLDQAPEPILAAYVFSRAILPEQLESSMRRTLVFAGVLALFAGAQAFAQTVGVGPAETVVIEPEQRTVIRQYVVKEKVPPVTVRERLSVGARLPADVELRTVPEAWGPRLSKYRYFYSDDRVYLVEPTNRTIIQSID